MEDHVPRHPGVTGPSGRTTVGRTLAGLAEARRGILWMLLSMLLAVSMDTVNKTLAQTIPVPQLVWARFVFHTVLLVLFLGRRLPRAVATRRPGLQVVRSMLLIGASAMFVTALAVMPLADANAIIFVAPILVAALSAPLLGERVGRQRWIGVALGFAGTLIIIRPGGGATQLAALLPLGSACLFALYQIATKQLSQVDPVMTTLFYTGLLGAMVTSVAVPFFWVAPHAGEWSLLVMLGVLSGTCHFCLIKAFEAAPAATVAPFVYTSLIWATLSGFVFFGDLPDAWTVVGAAIIVASGIHLARQERRPRDTGT